MQKKIEFTIDDEFAGQRIDQILSQLMPDYSRSRIQKWIKGAEITVNQQTVSAKHKLYSGDKIEGTVSEEEIIYSKPEQIELPIVFEDDAIIIINKPVGLVVHPGAGNQTGTLLNALLNHCPNLNTVPRAGIVHRLDKDTSGLMVVAKTVEAQTHLVRQLQDRSVHRQYLALVLGEFTGAGVVDANIGRSPKDRIKMAVVAGGKPAVTHYRIEKRYTGLTLLRCELETGRTHQIRVHMAHIKHPLVGDGVYAGRNRLPKGTSEAINQLILGFSRQALHATELAFNHPQTGEIVTFNAPLPVDFSGLLRQLEALDQV